MKTPKSIRIAECKMLLESTRKDFGYSSIEEFKEFCEAYITVYNDLKELQKEKD